MSVCTTTCRACTGGRFEHCKVDGCHHTFGGSTLGDAHRVITGSYVTAKPNLKSRNNELRRFDTELDVPKGWVTMSVGNTTYRCLTVEEMTGKGWRLVKDVWRGPEGPAWWDREDSEVPPAETAGSEYAVTSPELLDELSDILDELLPEITEPEQDELPLVEGHGVATPRPQDIDLDDFLADWDAAAASL